MAILQVLSCDNCGRLGSRAVHGGSESRKAANAGTIRRTELLRYRYRANGPAKPKSLDLCETCRNPRTMGMLRAQATSSLEQHGAEVVS